jgi:hypothetical protein
MKTPDMRPYFRAKIDRHVNGMFAAPARLPYNVRGVHGDVTDALITVEMNDGRTFTYRGGRYAARKINGCYAPLMPTLINGSEV